jgi:hypothetical protein
MIITIITVTIIIIIIADNQYGFQHKRSNVDDTLHSSHTGEKV